MIWFDLIFIDWIFGFIFLERGSKEFERFLTILGNKIRLKGWDKYRGGLDVKGIHCASVYLFVYQPIEKS